MTSRVKKGINIWSFDQDLRVEECMRIAKDAGFAGIELALSSKGEISMSSTEADMKRIRDDSDTIGITINSLATGLFWQYSLTSNRQDIREKAKAVVRKQLELARWLGADCILVCPGTVGVDFKPDEVVPDAQSIEFFAGSEVIHYETAWNRSLEALRELARDAEKNGVNIGVENIWNKFLLSPLEFRSFIDAIGSPRVGAFVDVANMLAYGYPEQWISILGPRIKKVHFKDYRRAVGSLAGFVDLLAGDVDWPAVVRALDEAGYDGWANAEMCPVYRHHASQIVYNASLAMDRILGRR
jgi:L-ribulose-5-phosphate 3-epimerase